MPFESRANAGDILKQKLEKLDIPADVIVSLPRGGAVVGNQIKNHYDVPVKLITVSKLKVPSYPDVNIGAVADDGTIWIERNVVEDLNLSEDIIEKSRITGLNRARKELNKYEIDRERDFKGKDVLLIDDAAKDRSRLLAAIGMLIKSNANQISVAMPVGSKYVVDSINEIVDRSLVLEQPRYISSIEDYFKSLEYVSESEIKEINKE